MHGPIRYFGISDLSCRIRPISKCLHSVDESRLTSSSFRNPQGVALDNRGNLWVVDAGSHTIRKINLATRMVSTIAGQAGSAGTADGSGNQARFSSPLGIALETATVTSDLERFFAGGAPPSVRMMVADTGNGRIRRVGENGQVETLAQTGGSLYSDHVRATEAGLAPSTLAFDGRLFITDLYRQSVVRLDANGFLDIVGNGDAAFSGDGGLATAASLSYPKSMVFDRFGNLFITDSNNHRIRAVRGPLP